MTEDAGRPKPISRAEARRLYETSDTPRCEIAGRLGIRPSSLSRVARENKWLKAGRDQRRTLLARRIRARVDRQIETIDQVLRDVGAPEADRAARTLATLVRSLRELQKYDAEQTRPRAPNDEAADEAPADAAPADLDALRDALADRLARFRRQHD